jgi:hypothetical protein
MTRLILPAYISLILIMLASRGRRTKSRRFPKCGSMNTAPFRAAILRFREGSLRIGIVPSSSGGSFLPCRRDSWYCASFLFADHSSRASSFASQTHSLDYEKGMSGLPNWRFDLMLKNVSL